MKCALLVVLGAVTLASHPAHAQDGSHFVYTGPLRVEDEVVARADHAPLDSVQARSDGAVDVALHHARIRFEASGDRAGLSYHVHAWTAARANGFELLIAPDAILDVDALSTDEAVLVTHDGALAEIAVLGAHAPPSWTRGRLESERPAQCETFVLHHARSEDDDDAMSIPAGTSVVRRTAADGWDEVWTRTGNVWTHGFAPHLACARPPRAGVGYGMRGSSGWSEPDHVRLPRDLRLVGRAHPTRVVMQVTEPCDAMAWAPGWSSTNDDAAIMIALPCGRGSWPGQLTFSPVVLVPLGAP